MDTQLPLYIWKTELFRFKVEWLTNGYSNKVNVERDLQSGILSEKVAKALLGVHKRCEAEALPTQPSVLDIKLLKQAYGNTGTL